MSLIAEWLARSIVFEGHRFSSDRRILFFSYSFLHFLIVKLLLFIRTYDNQKNGGGNETFHNKGKGDSSHINTDIFQQFFYVNKVLGVPYGSSKASATNA